ncbi:hypothetical protein IRJ41_006937 [Triplophysa rosa]|uniref:Uncharacterized protein n=1 Tax=Triplophysa rosa TaxID=992332 RepID=A0A9W8C4L6_TRIRA|nr:hypothetical protein IRJ41_006937 [Triplophysa rosa]
MRGLIGSTHDQREADRESWQPRQHYRSSVSRQTSEPNRAQVSWPGAIRLECGCLDQTVGRRSGIRQKQDAEARLGECTLMGDNVFSCNR